MKPTTETYQELQHAFDYFNKKLFGGELPDCLITLQRRKRTYGYYSPDRFVSANGQKLDEIAMNPTFFSVCPVTEIMGTLVHECCHMKQKHFGKPSRGGYHNKEWANYMIDVGLMPSDTGQEGGKKTGGSMSDYVIEGGPFDKHCRKLLTTQFKISWSDRFPDREKLLENYEGESDEELEEFLGDFNIDIEDFNQDKNKSNRAKYSCPQCLINVWGKQDINIICGDCKQDFILNI